MTDAATGNPIAGAQVRAYGDERYTAMTNAEGIYLMKDVPEYVSSVYITLDGCAHGYNGSFTFNGIIHVIIRYFISLDNILKLIPSFC